MGGSKGGLKRGGVCLSRKPEKVVPPERRSQESIINLNIQKISKTHKKGRVSKESAQNPPKKKDKITQNGKKLCECCEESITTTENDICAQCDQDIT
jgi:hypothetical protein